MTESQKFFFDLRGWLLVPGVLTTAEAEEVKKHAYAGGSGFTGPAAELLDHPVLVDILLDLLGDGQTTVNDDWYPFRCESSFTTIRKGGWKSASTDVPHSVGRGNVLAYQSVGSSIYSGLTRVVWELNPVQHGEGGTLFLSGTHKANFPIPDEVKVPENSHLETYSCPGGSLFIFSESLLHASAPWTNYEVDRVAIFNCYNSFMSQYHRTDLPYETIAAMPKKRQTLFRGVYGDDFRGGSGITQNRYYTEDSRAL